MRLFQILIPALLLFTTACNSQSNKAATVDAATEKTAEKKSELKLGDYNYNPPMVEGEFEVIEKSDAYWKERLDAKSYSVLREDGTERSFTSELLTEKRAGVFTCGACGLPLFTSDTKFKSGTGWPSFFDPINSLYVKQDVDERYGMRRVEVSCARCDGHQGHIFPDGPDPTGLRYCINGVSMDFIPVEDIEPYTELLMAEKAKEMAAEKAAAAKEMDGGGE